MYTSVINLLRTDIHAYKHSIRLRPHKRLPRQHNYVPHAKAFGKYLFYTHTHTHYQVAQLGEKRFENPQTANLHQVLVDCLTIHELMVEREREGEGEEEGAGRRRRKSTREKLVSVINQIFRSITFMGCGLVCSHFQEA